MPLFLYNFFVLLFLLAFILIFLRLPRFICGLLFFTWIDFIIAILSVLYIEQGIYLLEQGKYSYQTGAALRLEFFGIFFWGSILFISKYLFPKNEINNCHFHNKYKLTSTIAIVLLVFTYTNVFISGDIPLFSQGYISRFEYIETTRLWPILRVFGVTTIIIPMLIGIAAYTANSRLQKIVSTFLLIFYFFYILLIGQKFGGLMFGLYYYLMPRIISSEGVGIKVSGRLVASIIMVCLLALVTIFYHYSKYSLAQEYGGVINFIFYRIFGMQGHLWWGIDRLVWERSDMFNVTWNGFLNGMPYMMQMISPSIANFAISRGVNFTFGFYAFILLLTGFFAPLFFIFIASIWIFFARFIRSFAFHGIVPFIGLIYLHLWFVSFFSLGNLSSILSTKFIFVLSLLTIYFSMIYQTHQNQEESDAQIIQ